MITEVIASRADRPIIWIEGGDNEQALIVSAASDRVCIALNKDHDRLIGRDVIEGDGSGMGQIVVLIASIKGMPIKFAGIQIGRDDFTIDADDGVVGGGDDDRCSASLRASGITWLVDEVLRR